jgi:hypothetical protein
MQNFYLQCPKFWWNSLSSTETVKLGVVKVERSLNNRPYLTCLSAFLVKVQPRITTELSITLFTSNAFWTASKFNMGELLTEVSAEKLLPTTKNLLA